MNLDFEQNATVKVLSKKEEVKAEINLKTSKEVINDTNAIEIKQTGKFDVVVELDGQQQQHGYPIEIVSQSLIEQTFLFIIYDKRPELTEFKWKFRVKIWTSLVEISFMEEVQSGGKGLNSSLGKFFTTDH